MCWKDYVWSTTPCDINKTGQNKYQFVTNNIIRILLL